MVKKTKSQAYFDASLLHQVAVRRFTSMQVKELLLIVEKADIELSKELRAKLPGIKNYQSKRLEALLADLKIARQELMKSLSKNIRATVADFIKSEAQFENQAIDLALDVALVSTSVPLSVLKEVVFSKPFSISQTGAQTIRGWLNQMEATDIENINNALQLGIINGESVKTIVSRIVGTKDNDYSDGVLGTTRRNLDAIIRTAINHASNSAREEIWKGNEDIIDGLRWTSTLDGRTSAICRSRDGLIAPVGNKDIPVGFKKLNPVDARPPAHPRCRSIMVAVFDGIGVIGKRPFVSDARTREKREIDFESEAKAAGLSLREYKKLWASKNIGQVEAALTYEDWLKGQSNGFKEEVLGKTKAKLFNTGKIRLTEFVDIKGKEITLEHLAKSHSMIFELAGLNPKSY
jgi:SPP1 gp7 family putative phage head morphogenesis protein